MALTPAVWERDVLPRRLGAYSPAWLDELCTSGELVWIGAGALGRSDGRVAIYFREDVRLPAPRRPPTPSWSAPRVSFRTRFGSCWQAGPSFWLDLVAELEASPQELHEALWDLAWAGEVTNDAFAPLRAPPARGAPGRGARAPLRAPPPGSWTCGSGAAGR